MIDGNAVEVMVASKALRVVANPNAARAAQNLASFFAVVCFGACEVGRLSSFEFWGASSDMTEVYLFPGISLADMKTIVRIHGDGMSMEKVDEEDCEYTYEEKRFLIVFTICPFIFLQRLEN